MKSPALIGMLLAMTGTLFYTLMGVCVKLLPVSISNNTIIFARFSVGLLLILPWVLFDSHFKFKVTRPIIFMLRNISGLVSMACLYYSLKFIPLSNAILLANTFPLFIPLLVFILFRMKTSWATVLAIAVGFIGILVILQPKQLFIDKISLIAILGGLSTAFSFILLRQASKYNSTSQILFYFFLTCTIVSAIFIPIDWPSLTKHDVILLILVGVFGTLFQLLVTKALTYTSARATSPIMYLSVVLGGLADWLLWQHTPKATTVMGSIIVIGAGLVVTLRSQKDIQTPPPPIH